jgi:tetratricopeptide (TPR) repeat protein/O-antigen ligase
MKDWLLTNVINFLAKGILLVLAFFLPLFFLPITVDIFEFPKQILLWVSVLFLLVLTLLKFATEGEVKFLKTPLAYPILLFLSVYLISAVLAQNKNVAFLGFFGRVNSSFLAIFAYFAIFYFVSSYFEQLKEISWAIWAFLAGIFILSILAILYYFGIFVLPLETTKINSFSLAGGILPLSQILGASVPILLGILAHFQFSHQNRKLPKWMILSALCIALLITVSALILVNTIPGWIGLGTGLVIFFLLLPQETAQKLALRLLPLILVLISVGVVTQTSILKNKLPFLDVNLAKPQSLDLPTSWQVAAGTVRDYPLFGSGPGSFLSDFTKYRPIQLNLTDAWNLRFVQSGSLYLDILATTGILGLAAFLFIIFKYFQSFVNFVPNAHDQPIFPIKLGLSVSVLALLASFIFYSWSTVGLFLLAFFLGLFFSLARILGSTISAEAKFPAKPLTSFLIILALVFLFGFWLIARNLISNLSYFTAQKAAGKNDIILAQRNLVKATTYNPYEDTYWLDLARVNLVQTQQILQKKDLTDKDREQALQTLDASIRYARRATQLAPGKVINWEVLGDIYAAYATQIKGAADSAISAYSQAILLDPPNPNLWLKAGNLLAQTGNLDPVIDTFKQAVRLKPNLIDARIYLALALELKGEFLASQNQYEIAKNLTQTLQPGEVKTKLLEQIEKKLESLKTKTATPSATPTPR